MKRAKDPAGKKSTKDSTEGTKTVKGAVKAEEKKLAKKTVVEEEKKGEMVAAKAGESMNSQIIQQIERLMKYYQTQGDKGRQFAYRKALTAIKSLDIDINNAD